MAQSIPRLMAQSIPLLSSEPCLPLPLSTHPPHFFTPPAPTAPAAASFRLQQQQGGLLHLPAGAAAVPLPLGANLPNHTLSFRCMPPAAGAAAASAPDQQPLWSRPVTIRNGVETQLHVVVPVAPPEESETAGQQGGSSGDAAHLTTAAAAASPAGARGGACAGVAILRLSVHRRGPGGMHVVLESVQADPPYLLENRTPFPLRYRQVGAAGGGVLPACAE